MLTLIFSCASIKKTPNLETIMDEVERNVAKIENCSYSAVMYGQNHGKTKKYIDTVQVICLKKKSDDLYGKINLLFPESQIEYFYDFNNIYILEHAEKEVERFDVKKYGVGPIKGSWARMALYEDWLDPDFVHKYRKEITTKITFGKDTVINSKPCYTVRYTIKDDLKYNVTNRIINLFIEKKSNLPIGLHEESYFNGEYGTSRFEILKYDINSIKNEENINDYTIPDSYTYNEYIPREIKKLEVGDNVNPKFDLLSLESKALEFRENDKLILLDYWYMSCPPCIKASPYINVIYQKYHSEGLKVIGVNPFDKNDEKLKNFLRRKNIDYPIGLDPDKKTATTFGIHSYPTFILLDRKGKILFRGDGFSEEIINDLTAKIEEMIKS